MVSVKDQYSDFVSNAFKSNKKTIKPHHVLYVLSLIMEGQKSTRAGPTLAQLGRSVNRLLQGVKSRTWSLSRLTDIAMEYHLSQSTCMLHASEF